MAWSSASPRRGGRGVFLDGGCTEKGFEGIPAGSPLVSRRRTCPRPARRTPESQLPLFHLRILGGSKILKNPSMLGPIASALRVFARGLITILLLVFAQAPLAAQAPVTFTTDVSRTADLKATVDFTLFPIRNSNFEVTLVGADGSFTTHIPLAPRTYLGRVRGHPGAIACGWLRPDGTLFARVAFEDGNEWSSKGGNAAE